MDYKGYKDLKWYIQARLLRKYISILAKKLEFDSDPKPNSQIPNS